MRDLYTEADLYCAAFSWPIDDEVDWLLAQHAGTRTVLEPMCGNARYGPAFVSRGVRYHGFDLSREMLDRGTRHDGMTVLHADARSFTIPDTSFDLAWCPINSIRHLVTEAEIVGHLRRVRDHLTPGGTYVVESDLMNWDGPWPRGPDDKSTWTQPQADGSVIRACWRIDRCERATHRCWESARIERLVDGSVADHAEHSYMMRMMDCKDWHAVTAAGGFEIAATYAHLPGNERPRVELSADLANDGHNYYLFLRRAEWS